MKTKYPISREFFPFTHFTAPVNLKAIRAAQRFMRVPKFVFRDPLLDVEIRRIPAWKGGKTELYIFTPKGAASPMPCFINIHGGGFVFEGHRSHFHLAMRYAKEAGCKVVYVRYRLAPDFPFPYPQEDCYRTLCWAYEHAKELGIDPGRIGIGGDSAGGTLTVTSCMIARDHGRAVRPLFQLLIYPWLDDRNISDSYRRFTDTPMWNSTLSKNVGPIINPHPEKIPRAWHSPVEAETLAGMPPAYIEVAEFDSLHDDGILYAELLKKEGIETELHETRGTMHGFDTRVNAPTTRKMAAMRIEYMRRMFSR